MGSSLHIHILPTLPIYLPSWLVEELLFIHFNFKTFSHDAIHIHIVEERLKQKDKFGGDL